ncbi:MAG: hypothetical protein PHQ86_01165 [Dehalococcoidales bacterium]|nr:hypothetical protein [Dehalococcoidales bacterium]
MEKLICDRCGFEITDKDGINLVYEGGSTWANSVRLRGLEPRGILPCKNYIRCGGEIVVHSSLHQRMVKFIFKG